MDKATDAMKQYVDGDAAAFQTVYKLLAPKLLRHIRSFVKNNDTAEELLQQTFLRIHEHRHSFKMESSVATWAYRIASYLSVDYIRYTKHHDASECISEGANYDTCTPEDLCDAREKYVLLEECVTKLTKRQRLAYEVAIAEELNYANQAKKLSVSTAVARTTSFNMRNNLRRLMLERIKPQK